MDSTKVSVVEDMGIDEFLNNLGGKESPEELSRNLNIIGSTVKIAMDTAQLVDSYREIMNITDQSGLTSVRAADVEECISDKVKELLPPMVSMPAKLVYKFFRNNKDFDPFYELKWLGSSEANLNSLSRAGRNIRLRAVKLLSRSCGVELSKAVGLENISFDGGYTLAQVLEKVNGLSDVIERKKALWD